MKAIYFPPLAVALIAAAALLLPATASTRGSSAVLAGEKIDSGLGDLPHYRDWKDKTGRDPMGVLQLAAKR